MNLRYYVGKDGRRVYTLKELSPSGTPTISAHPAKFSPEDKFSKARVAMKKRYNLLPMQQIQE